MLIKWGMQRFRKHSDAAVTGAMPICQHSNQLAAHYHSHHHENFKGKVDDDNKDGKPIAESKKEDEGLKSGKSSALENNDKQSKNDKKGGSSVVCKNNTSEAESSASENGNKE